MTLPKDNVIPFIKETNEDAEREKVIWTKVCSHLLKHYTLSSRSHKQIMELVEEVYPKVHYYLTKNSKEKEFSKFFKEEYKNLQKKAENLPFIYLSRGIPKGLIHYSWPKLHVILKRHNISSTLAFKNFSQTKDGHWKPLIWGCCINVKDQQRVEEIIEQYTHDQLAGREPLPNRK